MMTESEKAEQDVAAARVAERIAEWKAMEAKASYYHYASKAMEASAEVMGARIRRDNAIAAEFADKVLSSAPAPTTVSDSGEGETKEWQSRVVGVRNAMTGRAELVRDVYAPPLSEKGLALLQEAIANEMPKGFLIYRPEDMTYPVETAVEFWWSDGKRVTTTIDADFTEPPFAYRILQDKDKDEESGELEFSTTPPAVGTWKRAPGLPFSPPPPIPGLELEFKLEAGVKLFRYVRAAAAETAQPQQPATPIPEGFIPWSGGECPISDDTAWVETIWRNGTVSSNDAGEIPARHAWCWDHGFDKPFPGLDVIAYRVVEPAADKPLIVDDTPTIPRSEIPQGAAVETFTDAGVETVKLSGITHIVDDSPERVAETQPNAAYAPIHNVDEPATPEQLAAAGIIEPGASEMAAMRLAPAPKKFGGIFSFGAKKTMAEEGV